MSGERPRVIIQGNIPVAMLCKIAAAMEATNPNTVALDANHPFSRQHHATIVMCAEVDEVVHLGCESPPDS